jgi:hypothetical protein
MGAGANAEVTLTSTDIPIMLPTFYIDTRKKTNGVISFTCFDKIMRTDQPLNTETINFMPPENPLDDEKIAVNNLIAEIAEQCGFGSYGGVPATNIRELTRPELTNKTCRQVLEMLSVAMCGYFYTAYPDVLAFKEWGTDFSAIEPDNYAPIDVGATKGPISRLIMVGNDKVYDKGSSGSDVLNTIKINTDLASDALADEIFNRISGYTYTSWQCSKMLLPTFFKIGCGVRLADNTVLIANNATTVFTATGVFTSCGSNDVTENEFDYDGKLTRDIKSRIAFAERFGRGQINPDGKYVAYIDKDDYPYQEGP